MYYVYVLKSTTSGRLYKGQTQNIPRALDQHNQGFVEATRGGIPWEVVVEECYMSRREATERESYFKSLVGSRELKKQLGIQ